MLNDSPLMSESFFHKFNFKSIISHIENHNPSFICIQQEDPIKYDE